MQKENVFFFSFSNIESKSRRNCITKSARLHYEKREMPAGSLQCHLAPEAVGDILKLAILRLTVEALVGGRTL